MKQKQTIRWLPYLLAITLTIQPFFSLNHADAAVDPARYAATEPARSQQGTAPFTLTQSTIGPLGGFAEGDVAPAYAGTIAPLSQTVARLSRADYRSIYSEAKASLETVQDYRQTRLQSIAENKVTTIAELEQNYMDFNNGDEFYRFCADYYAIDAQGYCPKEDQEGNERENLRNQLIRSRNSFAMLAVSVPANLEVDRAQNARTLAEKGVLTATRELANIHVIFGNEFMIDALDTVKSSSASLLGAENLVIEEVQQLDAAIHQFRLAVDAMVYAMTVDVGGLNLNQSRGVRLSDYFTDAEIQLFTIASERQTEAMTELAYRYRLLAPGTTITRGDGSTEIIQGEKSALELYKSAYQTQYLMAQTLAQLATERGVDYLDNGGWKAINNLRNIQQQADVLRSGFNPFGYQEAYVPREEFDTLLTKARERYEDADKLEKEALAAKRQFDVDASTIGDAKLAIIESYRTALVELCGGSGSESAVSEFSPCDEGLMHQNYLDMVQADRRKILARLRAENIDKEISDFQEATEEIVQITLANGKALSVDELSKAKLRANVTSISTLDTKSKSTYWGGETDVGAYFKAWLGGQASMSISPTDLGVDIPLGGLEIGMEIAAQCTQGYQHENTHTTAKETTFLPNEEALGDIESLAQMRQAESDAEITDVEGKVHVGNLLRQQTELLVEVELANDEYNQIVAEHTLLVQKYQNQINLWQEAERNTVESYLNNPSYRFLRDQATIDASRELRRALQYAYLATKALEYDFLQPVAGPNADIADLYRARNAGELLNYLNDLEAQRDMLQESPEPLSQQKYTISVMRDILGLSEPSPADMQAFIQSHLVTNEITIGGSTQERLVLDFQFITAINSRLHGGGFNPTGLWNTRITGNTKPAITCNVTNPCDGIGINIVTNQTWDSSNLPLLSISHGGQNGLQREDGSIVSYDPGPLMLNGEAAVGQQAQAAFRRRGKTAAVSATVNGQGGIQRNPQLFNLSISAAEWNVRLDVEQNEQLDLSQITDIQIVLDTTSRARTSIQAAANQGLSAPSQLDPLPELELIVGAAALAQPLDQLLSQPLQATAPATDPRDVDISELDPTGLRKLIDGSSDIRNAICCIMFAENLNECPDAKQLSLGGILNEPPASAIQAASISNIDALPTIEGIYAGTIAITEPIAMGEVNIGIAIDSVDGEEVAASLTVSNTLLIQGDNIPVNGSYVNGVLTLSSSIMTGTVAGRSFERRFELEAEAVRGGDALTGDYVETVTGLTLEPLVTKGRITSVRPVRNNILNDIPKGFLVDVSPAKIPANSTGTVTVKLRDLFGQPIAESVEVTFEPELGTIPSGVVPTVNGDASATYTAGDSIGTAKITAFVGDLRASATVEIVSDDSSSVPNNAPVANLQVISVVQGESKTIALTGSDIDEDPLTFTIVAQPANGTLSGDAPNLTYTPNAGFVGEDSFTFTANDGTVDSAPATVTINVTETVAPNTAPVANGQSINLAQDQAKTISLAGSDGDDNSLTFMIVTQPANGTLSGDAPDLTYTPNAGFVGEDSFTFIANDGTVDSAPATVTINVTETAIPNTAPVANEQAISTAVEQAKAISLTGSDGDGNPLTFTIVTQPENGTLSGDAPDLTYTPDVGFVGEDSFTFTANDGTVDSAQATVTINVTGTTTPDDPTPVPGEPTPVPGDPTPVPGDPTPVPGDPTPVPGDSTPVPGDPTPVPGDPTPVPGEPTPVPGEPTPVPGEPTPVGQPDGSAIFIPFVGK